LIRVPIKIYSIEEYDVILLALAFYNYSLNLSISIREGKENNNDSLSNCE